MCGIKGYGRGRLAGHIALRQSVVKLRFFPKDESKVLSKMSACDSERVHYLMIHIYFGARKIKTVIRTSELPCFASCFSVI